MGGGAGANLRLRCGGIVQRCGMRFTHIVLPLGGVFFYQTKVVNQLVVASSVDGRGIDPCRIDKT